MQKFWPTNFTKKALSIKKERLLSFDFFGVETRSNSQGTGICDWRRDYVRFKPELTKYDKEKLQEPYSHLIDAQIAFVLTADKHRNEGGLRLNIPDCVQAAATVKNGVLFEDEDLFSWICVEPNELCEVEMQRKKPWKGFIRHRSFTRDTFYADQYLPILMKRIKGAKVAIRVGYSWKNSVEITVNEKMFANITRLLPLCREVFP